MNGAAGEERRGTNYAFVPPIAAYDSLAEWERRREFLETQIRVAAGIYPEPPRTPLNPVLTGETRIEGARIQNVYFESLPGFYATGNLYSPLEMDGPAPGILCPHGHAANGRFEDTEKFSVVARCVTLARHGNVVFSPDMAGVNDSMQLPHHYETDRAYLWGISLLGLQLWNSIRSLDYLESLESVDADRLACVGASGGGTQTFLLAAVDRRVSVSVPVVMVSASMQGGCVCENAPLLRIGANNVEIAAMAAPRPQRLVSATGDWTKNTPEVEYPAIREIYRLYGAEERIDYRHVDAGHNFNLESRLAVYEWMERWLRREGGSDRWVEAPYALPPKEERRVFPSGLPEGTLTEEAAVDRMIVDRASREIRDRRVLRTLYERALSVELDRTSGAAPVEPGSGADEAQIGVNGAERVSARLHAPPEGGSDGRLLLVEGAPGAFEAAPFLERGFRVLTFDARYAFQGERPRHDLTFNLSDAAQSVQNVLAVCAYAAGVSDRLFLLGRLWSALALPYLDDAERVLLQMEGIERSDRFFERECFIPCVRLAGDLASAAALRAPHSLRAHGVEDPSPYARVAEAYAELGASDALYGSPESASLTDMLAYFS